MPTSLPDPPPIHRGRSRGHRRRRRGPPGIGSQIKAIREASFANHAERGRPVAALSDQQPHASKATFFGSSVVAKASSLGLPPKPTALFDLLPAEGAEHHGRPEQTRLGGVDNVTRLFYSWKRKRAQSLTSRLPLEIYPLELISRS